MSKNFHIFFKNPPDVSLPEDFLLDLVIKDSIVVRFQTSTPRLTQI